MCGFIGVGGPEGEHVVDCLLDDLAHRGPDDRGTWTTPGLTLGHRRLAIIGLDDQGRQPMESASGESVIVFNGEIYNYLEIADRLEKKGIRVCRRFDTAVLLSALETWGIEILKDLNGMFAFAWYQKSRKRLLLARDRWGKKPLFFGSVPLNNGKPTLVISSEFRTFTSLPGGPPPDDPLGIARFLVYDGMPADRTVYRNVFKVPAASWIEVDNDGNQISRGVYWEFDRRTRESISIEEAVERFEDHLLESVRLRLRADVPVGLLLSGGIDSSLLAATWRKISPGGRIRTFTVGFDDPSYDERSSARLMAEHIEAEHHEIVLSGGDLERELDAVWRHISEPFADPSIIPTSAICRQARSEVTVVLGGDGGDELQGGYDPFRAWKLARFMETALPRGLCYAAIKGLECILPPDPGNLSLRFKARHFAQGFLHPPEERIQGWMAGFTVRDALEFMHPDLSAHVDAEEVLEPTRRAFQSMIDVSPLHAQIGTWIKTYLESSILTKVDRASMMHSLEARAPFLDPALADDLLMLEAKLIFHQGRGKRVLRAAAHKHLPEELLHKPKKGLGVPQASWLRTCLRDRMEQCIQSNRKGGWFRSAPLMRMWNRHLSGKGDFRRPLWTFLFSFPFQKHLS